jgi:hypothetical protein
MKDMKGLKPAAALGAATILLGVLVVASALAGSGSTSDAASATAKFHDLAVAKKAGYGLLKDKNGIACIAMDDMPAMGAMGVHFVKAPLVGDGAINPSTPEALVYAPSGGKLSLAAVEYVVLKAAWDAKHAKAPALFGHTFNQTPAGNRFGLPAYYSLHAWIWKHNPAGKFAMWNPEVSCK